MLRSASFHKALESLVVIASVLPDTFIVTTAAQRRAVFHVFGRLRKEKFVFGSTDVVTIDGSLLLYMRIVGVPSETVVDYRLDGLVTTASYSDGVAHFHGSAHYVPPSVAARQLLKHLQKEKKR